MEKLEAVRSLAFARSLNTQAKVDGIQQILNAPQDRVEQILRGAWHREVPDPPAEEPGRHADPEVRKLCEL